MTPPTYAKTVIVGGGLTGLELAAELHDHGERDVLIVEAGPGADLRHVNLAESTEDALRLWLQPGADPNFRCNWTSLTPPHYTGTSGVRQRLGGRSLYWYGVMLRIEEWALAEPWWPRAVLGDLRRSWQGGESLYERIDRRLREWCGPEQQEHNGPPVSFAGVDLRSTPRATRPSDARSDRWHAYSPTERLWNSEPDGAGDAAKTGCVTGAEVTALLIHDGTCRGVAIRHPGGHAEISADRVVLCAGTLENSRLAIQALAAVDPSREPRLAGLADHIVHGVYVRLTAEPSARLRDILPSDSGYTAACPAPARSNFFVDVHPLPDGNALLEIRAMGEQMPSEHSYVECIPQGSHPWPVRVHSRPAPADQAMIELQRDILGHWWTRIAPQLGLPSRPLEFGEYDLAERGNDLALPEAVARMTPDMPVTWSNTLGTEDHEGGTLPLGSILSDDHEFVGISNLFAAGPSTFPRLGAANPSLTSLALVHRLAAKLATKADGGDRPCG